MKQLTQNKIEAVNTLNDYLNVLQSNFDCVNCTPGRLSKATVIYTITSQLSPQNAILVEKMKQNAMQAENVKEFIEAIQANFNTNQLLTNEAKQKLVSSTEKLILLVGLKEKAETPLAKDILDPIPPNDFKPLPKKKRR